MPGFVLTQATVAICPHGGSVSFAASQLRVVAAGSPALLESDPAAIKGCPFTVGTLASPCVTIRWSFPATRVKVNRLAVLLSTSLGMCLNAFSVPQGTVLITSTQTAVRAS